MKTDAPYDSPELDHKIHVVRESFDLGLDLDVAGQANPSIPSTAERLVRDDKDQKEFIGSGDLEVGESRLEKRKAVVSIGPLTLAADDPENPRLWSTSFKVMMNIILCVWVLSLTYCSTAVIASIPTLMGRFKISQEVAILSVTLFVLGFAAGPLVWGGTSELFGRRRTYMITAAGFSIFNWGAAEANTSSGLLICRFFAGFFGSASINNVPASIGDFTTPLNRGPYTVLYAICAFGGPSLGPLSSLFIQEYAGERWNLRVMAIFATLISLCVALLPETYGPTILKRKMAREGHPVPPIAREKLIGVYKTALSRPIIYLFTELTVTLISIYLSVLYGILYAFFQVFSVVYVDIRGFTPSQFALTYIALGLGFLVGAITFWTLGSTIYVHFAAQAKKEGRPTPPPEARLGTTYIGAIVSPISLIMFAWTAPYPNIHWIVPCIAEFLFSASMLMIFSGFLPFLIDCYMQYAASALASGMASRALIGSIFPLFALQMYAALTVQGATSLLAGLSLLLTPIPFIFYKYGRRMRAGSKYVTMDT